PVALCLEADCVGESEPGGGIARALHLDPLGEALSFGVAPADDGGVYTLLVLGPDVEEPGPLRSVEPLVGVTAVVVGTQCLEAHRHVAGRMGSVDDRDETE